MKTDYPGRTSCGCPYINRPDPADHYPECHYRLNSEVKPSEPQGGEEVEVVGYLLEKGNGLLSRMSAGGNDSPLMTVAQHRRLMAEQLERERGVVEALRFVRRSIQEAGLRTSLKTIDEALAAWEKNHG